MAAKWFNSLDTNSIQNPSLSCLDSKLAGCQFSNFRPKKAPVSTKKYFCTFCMTLQIPTHKVIQISCAVPFFVNTENFFSTETTTFSQKGGRKRRISAVKVIIEKSRGRRFLWNRNWDLGWIWAGLATFEAGFFMFSSAKNFF